MLRCSSARLAAFLVLGIPSLCHAHGAASEDDAVKEKAREIVAAASSMFEARHFDRAAQLYDEAYRILLARSLTKPELLFNAGLAYEQLGACEQAADRFGRFAEADSTAQTFPDFVERLRSARLCAPEVDIATRPAGAGVFIDGEPRGLSPVRIRLKAGPHVLRLELEAHESKEEHLDITEGTGLALRYDLTRDPSLPSEPAPVQLTTLGSPAAADIHAGATGWVWASGAVGSATLIAGSVLFALERSARRTVEGELEKESALRNSGVARDAADDVRTWGIGARIGLGVAAASLVTGGVLWLLDSSGGARRDPAKRNAAEAILSRSGAALSVEW